jgi:aspartate racemase
MNEVTIGILAGSGPEAGLDLWSKVLEARRSELGSDYSGDVDAPRVVVLSEPELGHSMNLETRQEHLWGVLEASARELTAAVDVWAIACNTLSFFAPSLADLELPATLVTPDSAVAAFLDREGLKRVGLLGARSVAELGTFSPYATLAETYEVDVPSSEYRDLLHELILEIKLAGGAEQGHAERLDSIVESLPPESSAVLLACTELPLVGLSSSRRLVDVTNLVATELVSFL